MALTPRQERELNEAILRGLVRDLRSLHAALDVLTALAQHEQVGTDVRAYLENFATLAEWTGFRNASSTFEDTLMANIATYLGEGLPDV